MKRYKSILTYLIFVSIILVTISEISISSHKVDNVKGYVVSSKEAGYWDGEDKNGHMTGGTLYDISVLYKDSNHVLRLVKTNYPAKGKLTSRHITFSSECVGVNLYLMFLILIGIFLAIDNIFEHKRNSNKNIEETP